MKQQIILDLFKQFFIYFIVGAVSIKVYKQIKTENITFKEYLLRRKPRLIMALLFIAFSIGYTFYMFEKI